MADAAVSNTAEGNLVWVRIPSSAPAMWQLSAPENEPAPVCAGRPRGGRRGPPGLRTPIAHAVEEGALREALTGRFRLQREPSATPARGSRDAPGGRPGRRSGPWQRPSPGCTARPRHDAPSPARGGDEGSRGYPCAECCSNRAPSASPARRSTPRTLGDRRRRASTVALWTRTSHCVVPCVGRSTGSATASWLSNSRRRARSSAAASCPRITVREPRRFGRALDAPTRSPISASSPGSSTTYAGSYPLEPRPAPGGGLQL